MYSRKLWHFWLLPECIQLQLTSYLYATAIRLSLNVKLQLIDFIMSFSTINSVLQNLIYPVFELRNSCVNSWLVLLRAPNSQGDDATQYEPVVLPAHRHRAPTVALGTQHSLLLELNTNQCRQHKVKLEYEAHSAPKFQ